MKQVIIFFVALFFWNLQSAFAHWPESIDEERRVLLGNAASRCAIDQEDNVFLIGHEARDPVGLNLVQKITPEGEPAWPVQGQERVYVALQEGRDFGTTNSHLLPDEEGGVFILFTYYTDEPDIIIHVNRHAFNI